MRSIAARSYLPMGTVGTSMRQQAFVDADKSLYCLRIRPNLAFAESESRDLLYSSLARSPGQRLHDEWPLLEVSGEMDRMPFTHWSQQVLIRLSVEVRRFDMM